MSKRKKDSIDWLCNQRGLYNLIMNLGARNLTQIKAVYITASDEEEVASYDKMVMHNSEEADRKAMDWVTNMLIAQKNIQGADDRYMYFRLKRWN